MVSFEHIAQLPEGADMVRPYTVREVADRWRLSVTTIHRMIKNGELSSFGPKGAVRIPAAEVVRVEGCGSSNTEGTGTQSISSTVKQSGYHSEQKTSPKQSKDSQTFAPVGLALPSGR